MPDEATIPILPCADIDEVVDFYRVLGFERTYRQTRPNPYVVVRRGGIELHFAAIAGFVPEDSYGSCIVAVDDTAAVFAAFAAGLRAAHGRLPLSGIPRLTRPRKRRNTGDASGFSVVDPGGNWIRFFQRPRPAEPAGPAAPDAGAGAAEPGNSATARDAGTAHGPADTDRPAGAGAGTADAPPATDAADTSAVPDRTADAGAGSAARPADPGDGAAAQDAGTTSGSPDAAPNTAAADARAGRSPGAALARALENAVVQGEARGDHRQAARILDGKLARDADVPAAVLVEALVYRAELAARLDDPGHAADLLRRVRATDLDPHEREHLAVALATADDLERDLPPLHPAPPG